MLNRILSHFNLMLVIGACLISACGQLTDLAASNETTNQSTAPDPGVATVSAGLYLKLESAWETAPAVRTSHVANCEIPLGSAVGSTITCTASIPEGQLFYSKLFFTVGTASAAICKRIAFYPYGYLASTSASYTPPIRGTSTTYDCSVPSKPKDCYDGIATALVEDYPGSIGKYFLTESDVEVEYAVGSANELKRIYNTFAASFMVDDTMNQTLTFGTSPSATYLANTKQDYFIACVDEYEEPIYSIDLIIKSIPFVGAGSIHIPAWL